MNNTSIAVGILALVFVAATVLMLKFLQFDYVERSRGEDRRSGRACPPFPFYDSVGVLVTYERRTGRDRRKEQRNAKKSFKSRFFSL